MADVKELEPKQSKSANAIVELLRGKLDQAFSEKVVFLEITTRVSGKTSESISISCHDLDGGYVKK